MPSPGRPAGPGAPPCGGDPHARRTGAGASPLPEAERPYARPARALSARASTASHPGARPSDSAVRASSPPIPTAAAAAARQAARWTAAVDRDLGRPGTEASFLVLRAVVRVFGAVLPPEPRAGLSDALPTLLRGALHAPLASTAGRSDDPLAQIDRAMRHAVRPQEAVRAVCAVLQSKLPPEVWASVREALPDVLGGLLVVPPHPLRPCSRPMPLAP